MKINILTRWVGNSSSLFLHSVSVDALRARASSSSSVSLAPCTLVDGGTNCCLLNRTPLLLILVQVTWVQQKGRLEFSSTSGKGHASSSSSGHHLLSHPLLAVDEFGANIFFLRIGPASSTSSTLFFTTGWDSSKIGAGPANPHKITMRFPPYIVQKMGEHHSDSGDAPLACPAIHQQQGLIDRAQVTQVKLLKLTSNPSTTVRTGWSGSIFNIPRSGNSTLRTAFPLGREKPTRYQKMHEHRDTYM